MYKKFEMGYLRKTQHHQVLLSRNPETWKSVRPKHPTHTHIGTSSLPTIACVFGTAAPAAAAAPSPGDWWPPTTTPLMASPLSFSVHFLLPSSAAQQQTPTLLPRHYHLCHRPLSLSRTRFRPPTTTTITPRARKGGDEPVDPPDRLISAACYLYPFLDGVQYGKYVVAQFPAFQLVLQPFVPAIRLFRGFPLNGVLIFFALYFFVVRNPGAFSRYVRFNTMQAIVLDVLLIFPDLLERNFSPHDGVGLDLVMSLDSTVFLFLLVCLIYGSTSCLLGQVPRLPIVAEAAERQVDLTQPSDFMIR
ncbi:hypothetical protein Taro_039932 [Colocasia esculenta]|uniref:Protein TIC 20 n=1 Tax=Colocasia esculenta TaxID=4460 RepID=A0A843WHT4_COLES|nr:hypothetical protein [Colocasia esculenta]